MAQLHETLYGKKLLEHDIPEIAKQLKRIADALEVIKEIDSSVFEKSFETAHEITKTNS